MANTYGKSGLTGGATTDLDGMDGANLAEGDRAMVITSDPYVYIYRLNATSGAAESSPDVIAPDNNAGTKRWILVDIYGASGVYLSNVVEDTIPQLGGQLDVNGKALGDGTLELLAFSETASAVNEITIKNAATGDGPEVQATGDDTNIDLVLKPKGTGSIVASGTMSLLDNILLRPKIKDYGESVNAISGTQTSNFNIDLENGNVQSVTIGSGTFSITFTNPPASGTAGSITLICTNAGLGTITWTNVDWAGGTAPAGLSSSGVDVLTFMTVDGGTTWYGFAAGLAMA